MSGKRQTIATERRIIVMNGCLPNPFVLLIPVVFLLAVIAAIFIERISP